MAVKPGQLMICVAASLAALSLSECRARHGLGHSFQHFRGPVYGEDTPVVWSDEQGKRHQDFAAPAHYEFAYGVEDHQTGDYHGQKEHRDGKAVAGEYTVKEPDGNVRTVKYHADEDGFHATVHNSQRRDEQPGRAYYQPATDDDDDDNEP